MTKTVTPYFDPAQKAQDILNLVAAAALGKQLSAVYADKDGVVSLRRFVPQSIERCQNGSAIVRVYDVQRKDTRKFRLGMLTYVSVVRDEA